MFVYYLMNKILLIKKMVDPCFWIHLWITICSINVHSVHYVIASSFSISDISPLISLVSSMRSACWSSLTYLLFRLRSLVSSNTFLSSFIIIHLFKLFRNHWGFFANRFPLFGTSHHTQYLDSSEIQAISLTNQSLVPFFLKRPYTWPVPLTLHCVWITS